MDTPLLVVCVYATWYKYCMWCIEAWKRARFLRQVWLSCFVAIR
jgi:hypothetical protein